MKKIISLLTVAIVSVATVFAQDAESVTIGIPSDKTDHAPYSFTAEGVQVSCSQGAIYDDYFSVYAGASITFSAEKPITALAVNGYLKQNFTATASTGLISYVDASDDAVEADPVLVVTNINATTVTLNCVKQMRMYTVTVYFGEAPDIQIGDGGGDGDYIFDWEPEEATTFNLTFDYVEPNDMSELLGYNAVDLYFVNEDAELDLVVFAPYVESTYIPVGTYAINDSYEEGTVQASIGGDDYMDIPSVLMTNFEEDGEYMYYDPYYIVSGTLTVAVQDNVLSMTLDAKSHFGSTIHAVYTEQVTALDTPRQENTVRKLVRGGQVLVEKNGHFYNMLGTKVAE